VTVAMPAVTESAMVPRLVAVTVSFRTPPITPLSPESVTVVLPTVDCVTPGGEPVAAALVKSSMVRARTPSGVPPSTHSKAATIHGARERIALVERDPRRGPASAKPRAVACTLRLIATDTIRPAATRRRSLRPAQTEEL